MPFGEEEVKDAAFGMDGEKSPSLDGFTMLFFQECWEIIKDDLFKVLGEFYVRSVMNKAMCSTFIVLIPKEEGQGRGEFCHISLVTSLYKIISKVLSLRLLMVMDSVVAVTQSMFIKGCQITDSILIANECVDVGRS